MGVRRLLEGLAFRTRSMRRQVTVRGASFSVHAWHWRRWPMPDGPPLGWLLDRVRPGEVVHDVGANRGYVSLAVAANVPGARVHAFEPNPAVHAMLRANVLLNPSLAASVATHDYALGAGPGEAALYVGAADTATSLRAEHVRRHGGGARSAVPVRIRTLDEVVGRGEVPPPGHLKIDTEGFEAEVLRGGLETLRRFHPVVYAECHADGRDGTNRGAIEDLLAPLGYGTEAAGWQLLCTWRGP
jgi:FkbM family methyltransferase